jgi:hypothetical protein
MCGKALPFRFAVLFYLRLRSELRRSLSLKGRTNGKPEAFRTSSGKAAASGFRFPQTRGKLSLTNI